MQEDILESLKKRIDHRLYTISDVLECEFSFEGFSKTGADHRDFVSGEILDIIVEVLNTGEHFNIVEVLNTGELPQLNPDYSQYCADNEIRIDKEKLLEYIKKNGYYVVNKIDVKRDHVELILSLKLIFLNFRELTDEILEKINYVKVKSFMGESQIGETKKGI